VVGGIALLYTFGRRGLLGSHLSAWGIDIAFTTTAVVLAQTFVALPFLVISLEGALRTAGTRYDVIAATLGASPTTVLRRVTLPLVLPGLVSGAVLSFARALGEFGAIIFIAGNQPFSTEITSLLVFIRLEEYDYQAAAAIASVLLITAFVMLAVTNYLQTRALRYTVRS
jgi:ABC-type sulfate transport system permease component